VQNISTFPGADFSNMGYGGYQQCLGLDTKYMGEWSMHSTLKMYLKYASTVLLPSRE